MTDPLGRHRPRPAPYSWPRPPRPPLAAAALPPLFVMAAATGRHADDVDVVEDMLREDSDPAGPPARLTVDAVLGRHLVAGRDIHAGEVILRCEPLVMGPKVAGCPACLGCNRVLALSFAALTASSLHKCAECGWPLCSAACQHVSAHTKECAVLRRVRVAADRPVPPAHWYAAVLPLRCLLLEGRAGRAVRTLQSHLEERLRDAPAYRGQGVQRRAAAFVAEVLGTGEEDALRMAATLDTNAFDVSRDGLEARALYGSVSMLSHDCRPNARCAMLSGVVLGVVAQRDIAAGAIISISYYADSLRGSLARRQHLRATKCFDCACARCRDPTDLGLHLDSVRCIQCRQDGGTSLLQSGAPLDRTADWRCPRCGFTLSADQMAMGHRRLCAQVAALRLEDAVEAEAFLAEHLGPRGLLHATSAHVLRVKQGLLGAAFAHIPGCTPQLSLSDDQLERAIAMSEEMLGVAAVLEPGLSVLRGSLLLRLLGLLLERARRAPATTSTRVDVDAARRLFREAQTIFMDLETEEELRKRGAMMEQWIDEHVVLPKCRCTLRCALYAARTHWREQRKRGECGGVQSAAIAPAAEADAGGVRFAYSPVCQPSSAAARAAFPRTAGTQIRTSCMQSRVTQLPARQRAGTATRRWSLEIWRVGPDDGTAWTRQLGWSLGPRRLVGSEREGSLTSRPRQLSPCCN
ncbi:uncharacterized protein LOC117638970 [Thrips palmi]|uniref:Uncharacterized protein LOC117638970 n=1 Tax=Thrips palmi TaxID=161013 RepID=A0A6P8Y280_THRPL|nr:uncharacterized protein LOC117638970 [Thrips palmi]